MMGSSVSRIHRPRRTGFTLVEMLVVIVIIMILAALLLPTVMKAICNGRAASMESLLGQLEIACNNYKLDHGDNPKSNGAFESSVLVAALTKPSLKHSQYYEFKASQIGRGGNIVNAVWPEEDFIKYRNNYMNTDSKAKGLHNKSGIDLWCMGCDKVADSINNWE
jgi:prepilin-type N-terminal cleavage/methylation domain-containing protein